MIVNALMSSDKWRRLLTDDPSNELVRFSLAKALLDEGRNGEAVGHFDILVKEKPDYALAWAFLARARLMTGDKDGARRACEQGLPVARAQKHEVPTDEILAVLEELESDF